MTKRWMLLSSWLGWMTVTDLYRQAWKELVRDVERRGRKGEQRINVCSHAEICTQKVEQFFSEVTHEYSGFW